MGPPATCVTDDVEALRGGNEQAGRTLGSAAVVVVAATVDELAELTKLAEPTPIKSGERVNRTPPA